MVRVGDGAKHPFHMNIIYFASLQGNEKSRTEALWTLDMLGYLMLRVQRQ